MPNKYKIEFITDNPKLMAEWDFNSNSSLNPTELSIGSNKKVSWICSVCGHHWIASINNRARLHSGCPGCANREVVIGKNDLATTRPELISEWHPIKNGALTPQDVTTNSSKLVWWKCSKCGYEWQKKVKDKLGCPSCAGRVLIPGKNDLYSQYPDIVKEWNYEKNVGLDPKKIRQSSHQQIWWKCSECGYEWQASINNRTGKKSGCPICTKSAGAVKGKTDFLSTHPELAKEWHPTKNTEQSDSIKAGSYKKVWWLCSKCRYEWEMSVHSRCDGGSCPRCYHATQTSFPEQALYFYIKKLYPDAISRYKAEFLGRMELDIFIPSIRFGIEYDGMNWHTEDKIENEKRKYKKCKENHIKLIRIKEKLFTFGNEIQEIADEQIKIIDKDGIPDLETTLKYVINRLSFWNPNLGFEINLKNDEKEIRKLYQGIISDSLSEKFPNIAAEWHPKKNETLRPDFFHYGSEYEAWWLCPKCGFEYQAPIKHRTRKRANGCPVCSHQRLVVGMNDLATTHPNLAAEWHPTKNGTLKPNEIISGMNKKFWWKCSKCGYDWEATIVHRKHSNSGCPICSNRKIIPGVNDLATFYPDLVKEWHPFLNGELTPSNISPRSGKKVWWKCSICGKDWQAIVAGRVHCGTLGCKSCNHRKERLGKEHHFN